MQQYADIEKVGTWIRYKKGLCDTCMAGCCMLVVEISHSDMIRLGLTDEWEIEHCLKDLVKRLKKEKIIKRYHAKKETFVLAQHRGTDCIFLDKNRRCRDYKNRPEVCRNHPEIASPRIGFCPYSPKG